MDRRGLYEGAIELLLGASGGNEPRDYLEEENSRNTSPALVGRGSLLPALAALLPIKPGSHDHLPLP